MKTLYLQMLGKPNLRSSLRMVMFVRWGLRALPRMIHSFRNYFYQAPSVIKAKAHSREGGTMALPSGTPTAEIRCMLK